MCLNNRRILNRSVYGNHFYGFRTFDIPCGTCDECRSLMQSEWSVRLSFDIKQCYDAGGVCVFLTFTYDNEHIPHLVFDFNGHHYDRLAFSRKNVLTFLHSLKKAMWTTYGSDSSHPLYRYFFCSERGSSFDRPHHHCLFFLYPSVSDKKDHPRFVPKRDWPIFVETCRILWSERMQLGYTFPRFQQRERVEANRALAREQRRQSSVDSVGRAWKHAGSAQGRTCEDERNRRVVRHTNAVEEARRRCERTDIRFAYVDTKLHRDLTPLLGRPSMGVDRQFGQATPLNDFSKAAFYVSKYACKDLDFFDDVVSSYISVIRKSSPLIYDNVKDFLPKHWQSNGIGSSILATFKSDDDILAAFRDGVTVPYSHKAVSLPRYCQNKILYKSVRSDDYENGIGVFRTSPVTGKLLYDRLPTDFGLNHFADIYKFRHKELVKKYDIFFTNYTSYNFMPSLGFSIPIVRNLVQSCKNILPYSLSSSLANYHMYLSHAPLSFLGSAYSLDTLFSVDFCAHAFALSKDTYNNAFDFGFRRTRPVNHVPLFSAFEVLDSVISRCQSYLSAQRLSVIKRKMDSKKRLKSVLGLFNYSHL